MASFMMKIGEPDTSPWIWRQAASTSDYEQMATSAMLVCWATKKEKEAATLKAKKAKEAAASKAKKAKEAAELKVKKEKETITLKTKRRKKPPSSK